MMSVMKHYGLKFQKLKILLNKDNPVIIEIGSHYGEDTLRLLETFPNANIHCFEPDDRNIKIFNEIVNDNRVVLHQSAISNKNGKARFFKSYKENESSLVPEKYDFISLDEYQNNLLHNSGSSSIKKGYPNCFSEKYYVQTIRFDDWYNRKDIGSIDFVWIDVQGAEYEVIDGMGSKIQNISYIWMEYGEDEYNGALNRDQTIELLFFKNFSVVEHLSSNGTKGDLMFQNNLISGIC